MAAGSDTEGARRPRGRPRVTIDRDAVADAVAQLFAEGGYDAVTIVNTAEKLSISRATLYRTVPTKEDLLGILLDRSTKDLADRAKVVVAEKEDPGEQLIGLVRLQVEAAVTMRSYMPVFFGGGGLPSDVVGRWQTWSRQYEKLWLKVVTASMSAGYLEEGDPKLATRMILGMLIWVSRWYRPNERFSVDQIADEALALLQLTKPAPTAKKKSPTGRRRSARSTTR